VRFAVGDLVGSHVGSRLVVPNQHITCASGRALRGHASHAPPPRATPSLMDALQMVVWYVKWYLHFANLCYAIKSYDMIFNFKPKTMQVIKVPDPPLAMRSCLSPWTQVRLPSETTETKGNTRAMHKTWDHKALSGATARLLATDAARLLATSASPCPSALSPTPSGNSSAPSHIKHPHHRSPPHRSRI
jgi:hypothetical protein